MNLTVQKSFRMCHDTHSYIFIKLIRAILISINSGPVEINNSKVFNILNNNILILINQINM